MSQSKHSSMFSRAMSTEGKAMFKSIINQLHQSGVQKASVDSFPINRPEPCWLMSTINKKRWRPQTPSDVPGQSFIYNCKKLNADIYCNHTGISLEPTVTVVTHLFQSALKLQTGRCVRLKWSMRTWLKPLKGCFSERVRSMTPRQRRTLNYNSSAAKDDHMETILGTTQEQLIQLPLRSENVSARLSSDCLGHTDSVVVKDVLTISSCPFLCRL